MRWLLLCLPDDSSTPQIFHLSLCNCAPTDHSGKKNKQNINIIVSDSYNTFVGFFFGNLSLPYTFNINVWNQECFDIYATKRVWSTSRQTEHYLYIPDMDTLVKGSAGQVFAVGTEGHTVDGLLVFGQGVETPTLFYLP